ncbi:MAG TPA: GNAT family N-acetyltransferase [bacterium]|jgi:ribosomal protein S18 acetylase RimI-like enzyme|nr:GNAT family N-acetyltransferase [bacterium]
MNTLIFTSDGPWTVRDLKADDAPRVLALLREVAQSLKKRGSLQWASFLEGGEDIVARRFREGSVILAERGGQDAGCMVLQNQDGFWDELGKDGTALWVHSLAVRPAFNKRGLGKALLDLAGSLARAKGKAFLRLDVYDGNTKLKAYYARLGFQPAAAKAWGSAQIRLMEKPLQ